MGPVKFPACYRGHFCVRQKVDLKRKFFVTVFRSSIKNCRILDSSWLITYEYKHDYAQIATYKYRYRSHLRGKRVMLGTLNIQMRIFFFKALGYSVRSEKLVSHSSNSPVSLYGVVFSRTYTWTQSISFVIQSWCWKLFKVSLFFTKQLPEQKGF